MRRAFLGALVALAACGGQAPRADGQVLAESGRAGQEAAPGDLVDRVLADERRAAFAIREAMCGRAAGGEKKAEEEPCGDKKDAAAWAAVDALRLGIEHDAACAVAALRSGARSGDELLAALCWRWLAERRDSAVLPKWRGAPGDPVVAALAALAHARVGAVPRELATALGLPDGEPPKGDRDLDTRAEVERLVALAAPYDNGPLALAVAFVDARASEVTESGPDGKAVFAANRLRAELAHLLLGDDPLAQSRATAATGTGPHRPTALLGRLESALVHQPLEMLRSIALTGKGCLRRDALRALAVAAREPEAGDLGAAAAGLEAADPALRLEAARTFLLLSLRAHRAAP